MIGLAIILGYICGWLTTSAYTTRWIADNHSRCNGRSVDGRRHLMDGNFASSRNTCIEWHGDGCWRADGEITTSRFAAATALSVAWPALLILGISWSAANKRPTAIGLQREIERLEREAGLR